MTRRELIGTATAALGTIALVATETGCSAPSLSNFGTIFSAVTAGVDILLPVIAIAIPGASPFVTPVQAALAATQTFVAQGAAILASTSLSAAEKAQKILAMGSSVLAQLKIPGVPASVGVLLDGIAASIQAVLTSIQASAGVAAKQSHVIGAAAVNALAKPTPMDIRKLKSVSADAEALSGKIVLAFK